MPKEVVATGLLRLKPTVVRRVVSLRGAYHALPLDRRTRAAPVGDSTWHATFFVTGRAHSIVGGSAWEPTPWSTVQLAAWAAVIEGA
jgi:hypothetical protein